MPQEGKTVAGHVAPDRGDLCPCAAAGQRGMSTGRLHVDIWPQRQVRGSTVLGVMSVNARTPQLISFLKNVA